MKVGFVVDAINIRGMAVASYDYANYNEKILNNESIVFYNEEHLQGLSKHSFDKFNNRFSVMVPFLDDYKAVHAAVEKYKIDYIHRLSWGHDESAEIFNGKNCPWGIHVVFKRHQPYGDKYVYISEWLRNVCCPLEDYVPHIIDLPHIDADLRQDLGIGTDKFVFGGMGDRKSFDIDFAKTTVVEALNKRSDLCFVFLHIEKFCDHERCIFLPGTADMEYKTKFINTCDAMIHARKRGETFGLSVGEFSSRNKRIVTYSESPEQEHYRILGDRGIYYKNEKDLLSIFLNIAKDNTTDFDCYSKPFSPESVMAQFSRVFFGK